MVGFVGSRAKHLNLCVSGKMQNEIISHFSMKRVASVVHWFCNPVLSTLSRSSLIVDAYSLTGTLLLEAEIETAVISTGAAGVEVSLSATAGMRSSVGISEHWGVIRTFRRSFTLWDIDHTLHFAFVINECCRIFERSFRT